MADDIPDLDGGEREMERADPRGDADLDGDLDRDAPDEAERSMSFFFIPSVIFLS